VAIELPGVKADQVEITFEGGLPIIQGERHFAHDSADEKMHRTERFYGDHPDAACPDPRCGLQVNLGRRFPAAVHTSATAG
jgi:hypothetical protein